MRQLEILLHITTPQAAGIAAGLGRAMNTTGTSWGCFLTNDGVKVLDDPDFAAIRAGATRIAVCEHSWDLHMAGHECPVERGSQTINSVLMLETNRVVSL